MQKKDTSRRPSGRRREDAIPSTEPTPAPSAVAKALTAQELEQVRGGDEVKRLEGPEAFRKRACSMTRVLPPLYETWLALRLRQT